MIPIWAWCLSRFIAVLPVCRIARWRRFVAQRHIRPRGLSNGPIQPLWHAKGGRALAQPLCVPMPLMGRMRSYPARLHGAGWLMMSYSPAKLLCSYQVQHGGAHRGAPSMARELIPMLYWPLCPISRQARKPALLPKSGRTWRLPRRCCACCKAMSARARLWLRRGRWRGRRKLRCNRP